MSKRRTLTSVLNTENNKEQQPEVEEQPQTELETQEEETTVEESTQESLTVTDVAERIKNKYQEKSSRPTVEDTHVRSTFLFRKDLSKRLDKLAKNKRGFKTMFINEAIEALLNEYENNK